MNWDDFDHEPLENAHCNQPESLNRLFPVLEELCPAGGETPALLQEGHNLFAVWATRNGETAIVRMGGFVAARHGERVRYAGYGKGPYAPASTGVFYVPNSDSMYRSATYDTWVGGPLALDEQFGAQNFVLLFDSYVVDVLCHGVDYATTDEQARSQVVAAIAQEHL